MTEPLFLCEMIWIAVWLVEWRACLDDERKAARLLWLIAAAHGRHLHALRRLDHGAAGLDCDGLVLLAARQAALARFWLASAWWWPRRWRGSSITPRLRRLALLCARALLGQGHRDAHLRAGLPPHPGWHNPWVSLLFFMKAARWTRRAAWGNTLLALSLLGTAWAWLTARRRAFCGRCCCGCRFPSTRTRWPTGRCPSFCPSGGRTPGTTRATEWRCCRPCAGAGLCRAVCAGRGERIQAARGRVGNGLPWVRCRAVRLECDQMVRERPLVYVEGTKNIRGAAALDDRFRRYCGTARRTAGRAWC
jgi:hypothetical protein